MAAVVVDFSKEKEAGYRRIFERSPLLSSVSVQWDRLLVAYDYFLPGQTPEICSKQHGLGIFVEMAAPAEVTRMIDGRCQQETVNQGDVVIVPAGAWSQTTSSQAGGAIVLGLEPEELIQTMNEIALRDRLELIPHFATSDPLMHQIGRALKRALENPNQTSPLYVETMTTALMVHLAQYYSSQQLTLPTYTGGLSKFQLQLVLDYIQAHLNHDLSLKELAALVQISPHYFVQLFKQSIGMPPHQYVIRVRIERAKFLLTQQQMTIAEVAATVGFVDQSHFHRHFKRLVGVTPKTFIRQTSL
jgi:AraC family transcriptional regulator